MGKLKVFIKKFKNACNIFSWMIIWIQAGGESVAFADKKAAFAYVNEYQKEKYDRITVMAEKGKKADSLNML